MRTLFAGLVTLAFLAAAGTSVWGQSPPNNPPDPARYFLDAPPDVSELSRVPAGARDVIVGKVRLLEKPFYLIEPEHEKRRPLPKDLWSARIEFIEINVGHAQTGTEVDVFYGVPGRPSVSPIAPHTIEGEYFVVSYLDHDGARRLLDFPISAEAYREWSNELMRRLRERDGNRRTMPR